MSIKSVAVLAKEIVLSPESQRRLRQKRVQKAWWCKEAVRMAKEFSDLEMLKDPDLKDDLESIQKFFISRAAQRLDVGVGPRAIDLMGKILEDVRRNKFDCDGFEEQVDNLVQALEEELDPKKKEARLKKVADDKEKAAKKQKSDQERSEQATKRDAEKAAKAAAEKEKSRKPLKDLRELAVKDLPIHASAVEKYLEAGLDKVGNLIDFSSNQKLSEVPGVGPKWEADTIEALRSLADDEAAKAIPALKS